MNRNRTCHETYRIYDLPETTDRMAELLRGPSQGYHTACRKHIELKKRQIRQRRLELGLDGQSEFTEAERTKQPVAVADLVAAWRTR